MPTAPYQPYVAPTATNPIAYNNSTDPRKATANQRQYVTGEGDALQSNDQTLANQYASNASGTQNYLNPIESGLASGQGGYTSGEASQIELTPGQEQNIATNAGISAGAGTASAVGAAERATAAAGGNPAAMAAYRARAAQSEAANAGQASTGGQVAAQQAGSAGAQAVGNAQIAEQNQGLGYYGSLQGQQSQASQNEQGLQQGAYGTEAGTGTTATGQVLSASQTPSTSDKVIGALSGAAQGAASFLADGTSGYLGQDAILGESGPEVIIEAAGSPHVNEATKMMDAGGMVPPASPPAANGTPTWLAAYLANAGKQPDATAAPPQQQWNKTTPYAQMGTAIGSGLKTLAGKMSQPSSSFSPAGGTPPGSFGSLPPAPAGTPSVSASTPAAPSILPGTTGTNGKGLINRTGGDVDGTPSLGMPEAAAAPADLVGDGGDIAGDLGGDVAGAFADGTMTPQMGDYRAHSMMASGSVIPRPHVPLGGYQPERYRPKQMLADGAAPMGPPTPAQTEAWKSPDIHSEIASDADYMMRRGVSEQQNRKSDPADSRGFADYAHDNMQTVAGEVARKSRSANAYPSKPPMAGPGKSTSYPQPASMKADGDTGMAAPTAPTGLPQAPSFNPSKLVTSPTRVHLQPGDAVVPLSYRPKAKVRPSAAMPALAAMRPHHYGAARV